MPAEEIPVDTFARYRIYIDDEVIVIYQNERERLRIPNPYRPGIARLFFAGSSDKMFLNGFSEVFVEWVHVYQVSEGEHLSLVYDSLNDPDTELLTNNTRNCFFNPDGELEATWIGNAEESCSVHFDENLAEKKVQMTYEFLAAVNEGAAFVPGLWEPMMNFDFGIALAAGLVGMGGLEFFIFLSCSFDTDPADLVPAPPSGTGIRVVSGHDPYNEFSFAVFQEEGGTRDFLSIVKYNSVCFELTDFGISSKNCEGCEAFSASGSISNILVKTYDN